MLTAAQRRQREARVRSMMDLISSGNDLVEVMIEAFLRSELTDDEIENLSNRIGRIPHERMRK